MKLDDNCELLIIYEGSNMKRHDNVREFTAGSSQIVVGKPCCSSVELFSPKSESGLQQDNLLVGSNRPGDLGVIGRCRLDR